METAFGDADVILPFYLAPAAVNDLQEIVDFIARDKPAAAENWRDNLFTKFQLLASQPGLGEADVSLQIPDLKRFSWGAYVIFFRVFADRLEIYRVLHGSRDLRNI